VIVVLSDLVEEGQVRFSVTLFRHRH